MAKMAHLEKYGRSGNGFTIVELLIAITLVGVIMTLVFSGVWTARRSWESVLAKIDATESMRLAQGFLRRNISQARTLFVQQEEGQQVLFQGDSIWVQFVAPAPVPVQLQSLASLYLYTLRFVAGDLGKGQMQVSYVNYLPGRTHFDPEVSEETFVLIEDVAAVKIEYFSQENAEGKARWLARWERVDGLPDLIRFKITVSDGNDDWPELVIPIRGMSG